ncbi:hypothetical protein K7472_07830 [Streptomyces sp. PTM05]|uniref:Uncharacterized protein n=1 Tax=Streptantibioticus parmotrematis TaxID=2873249 RepID=A0ABS7QNK5_9ACTN|nr:hypothetical protein [Streptantibioticus parmotrematis]MBY8884753.1 hypothetical protein [Streptantibioticus parmotrematis]
MSEIDERRIAALAKEPPRVLRGGVDEAARGEARKLVECQALLPPKAADKGQRDGRR